MEVRDGIYVLPDLLSPQECDALIASTEAHGYDAAPITTARGFEMRPDIRNNTRVIIDDEGRAADLWRRSRDELPGFLNGRQAIGLNERFRFYRYDPGERFAPHRDGCFRRDSGEMSLLTFLVYLNEGFEGGETVVEGLPITPHTGMALIFEHQLIHEGAAVTQGRKYVMRSDVMFGRFGQIRG